MMHEEPAVEMHELAIDEICELLAEGGASVTAEQAAELAHFVQEAGGLDEALQALAVLTARRAA